MANRQEPAENWQPVAAADIQHGDTVRRITQGTWCTCIEDFTGFAADSTRYERLVPLAARRAEVTRSWPKPQGARDADELRKWVVHGDYSNVFDPWHSLIEAWEKAQA